ncbi:MAG: aminoacyl-tRNA hydrolase [Planctomycetales bacterium 4572_13]|nr:MAG: aminoacyl-tRNA hydrolase [Planctomycetales bacterium 4572_13]
MKLIVGLGNPGSKYDQMRHNVGFGVVDALAAKFGETVRRKKFNALTEEVFFEDTKLLLLKPQQYMNRSGHAVATAAGFYKIDPADILIVTDDMALEVGRLRLRAKGSAGGHNGLKDVIARLGRQDFSRLRVGIGDSGRMDAADFVLSRFSADERESIDRTIQTAVDAILCWLRDGVDLAMTRYNVKNGSAEND